MAVEQQCDLTGLGSAAAPPDLFTPPVMSSVPSPHEVENRRLPPSVVPASEAGLPRTLVLVCALAFAVVAGVAYFFARGTGVIFLRPLAMLGGWAVVVALAGLLPSRFRTGGLRQALILLGAVLAIGAPGNLYRTTSGFGTGVTDDTFRLVAVAFAVGTFGLFFLATLVEHTRRERPHPVLDALIPLCRLLSAALAVTVAVLLARLYGQWNLIPQAHQLLVFVLAVLVTESTLYSLARLYQPKRLRAATVFGDSVVLPALFGHAGPLRSLSATLERIFGVRLGDTWLVRLGRALVLPLVCAGLLAGWLSTGLTQVPVDSRGVRLTNGLFHARSLPPGLHVHLPWPWGRVVVVPTARVQEFSIGFERDLDGPILWAEKHFEGEQNLLVGHGEELITVNVPVQYRVRDAVAFLRNTSDARAALEALGFRELLDLTNDHTAFGLMTTDRAEISTKLRASLQAASDARGLGLVIVFVGFKDVHPPVPVVPAYQDVVSAEEQHESLVDQARSFAVATAADGRIGANQVRLQAETAAHARLARAGGESSRFLATLDTWQAHPDVFKTRLQLEATEVSLGASRQLYLVPAGAKTRSIFLPPGATAPPGAANDTVTLRLPPTNP